MEWCARAHVGVWLQPEERPVPPGERMEAGELMRGDATGSSDVLGGLHVEETITRCAHSGKGEES